MEFYYFGGNTRNSLIRLLDASNFSGVMFTYDATRGDMFTLIARDMRNTEKIKYLVAIRPHTISPQYLCMIKDSINSIIPNRIQINLISGHIKEHEKNYGGVLGDVSDLSNHMDRSNYLIEYIKELNKMNGNKDYPNFFTKIPNTPLDYYVSTTNQYTLDLAHKYDHKIILPYRDYKNMFWTLTDLNKNNILDKNGNSLMDTPIDLKNLKVMISLSPVIRETHEELDLLDKSKDSYDTEYFTYEEFESFIKKVKKENITQLLLGANTPENQKRVIKFVENYTVLNATKP
jgi:hypothetical protein